jgi:hypothetical protein
MSLTKQTKAHAVAVQLVAPHGVNWMIEDCNLTAWATLWGKSLHAFAPGMVTSELSALTARLGGSLTKVATGPTALSSHCLCGRRTKKELSARRHVCVSCGFTGHRDLVAATLGTCVVCADPNDPRSARVNYALAAVLQAELSTASIDQISSKIGCHDTLTSQTHPLVSPRRSDAVNQGARSVRSSHRNARLKAHSTVQSTVGPSSLGPAKVVHGSALARSSPPGDLRLSS